MNVEVRGSTFTLLPERALYWPNAGALICSDLHWGRELFMQKNGMPIPEMSFARETAILEKAFSSTGASEWWILGDFIHHPDGLEEGFLVRMISWCQGLLKQNGGQLDAIRFVPGNHDKQLKKWIDRFPFIFEKNGIERDGFRFLHEPPTSPAGSGVFSWYGHLHPAVSPPILGRNKLPCFWIQKEQGFLPAFSRLAAGLEVDRRPDDRILAIVESALVLL